jgi:hypothetical protein
MGKNPASYQKMQREIQKKLKKQDKLKRREQQRNAPPNTTTSDSSETENIETAGK